MDLIGTPWRKSSYSGTQGDNCVEVRSGWRKSSYSNSQGECVEVRAVSPVVAVRDSKNPGGPALLMPPGVWRAFTGGVRAGQPGRA